MHEAKLEQDWSHTASLMALLANVNRDPRRQRAFSVADFHPMWQRRRSLSIHDLKPHFKKGAT